MTDLTLACAIGVWAAGRQRRPWGEAGAEEIPDGLTGWPDGEEATE